MYICILFRFTYNLHPGKDAVREIGEMGSVYQQAGQQGLGSRASRSAQSCSQIPRSAQHCSDLSRELLISEVTYGATMYNLLDVGGNQYSLHSSVTHEPQHLEVYLELARWCWPLFLGISPNGFVYYRP